MNFSGNAAGTGTLVLVNQPTGDPPLQTYALPVYVKTPKAPITVQLNHNDNNETRRGQGGRHRSRCALPDQPSTGFQWKFDKPERPRCSSRSASRSSSPTTTPWAPRARWSGRSRWSVPGKVPLMADYQQVPAQAMPVKTWQVNVAAKPGFTPKTVEVVDTYPADTVHV